MNNLTIVYYIYVNIVFFHVKELFVKKVPILIVGVLALIVGYLYISPYLALNNIKSAAQERNAEKLSSYIDFPSVRLGVKEQLKAKVAKEMVAGNNNNGFEALGSMFAVAMIDPMVDAWVTPDGIAALVVEDEKNGPKDDTSEKEETNGLEYETGYDSFNDFHVNISNPEEADNIVKVTLHRDGLSWNIVGIDFPLDDF